MQLIDREKLIALAKADDSSFVDENDANSRFSYEKFLEEYCNALKAFKPSRKYNSSARYSLAFEKMDKWLKKFCPPIRFVGQGSSRIAYAMNGGKCLKLAMNDKGIAQNSQEIKNTAENKAKCFPQIYDWDKKTNGSMLTECCAKAVAADFVNLFGIDMNAIVRLLKKYSRTKSYDALVKETTEEISLAMNDNDKEYADELKKRIGFVQKLKSRKTMAFKIIGELFDFYSVEGNADEMLVSDLINVDNWGLAVRNRRLCLIVIDAGFSSRISQEFYN